MTRKESDAGGQPERPFARHYLSNHWSELFSKFSSKLVPLLSERLIVDLLIRKLGKAGVRVTPSRGRRIRSWVINGRIGKLSFRSQHKKIIDITFTPRDERRAKAKLRALHDRGTLSFVENASDLEAEQSLRILNKNRSIIASRLGLLDLGFRRRTGRKYQVLFEWLTILWHSSSELSETVGLRVFEKSRTAQFVEGLVMRLHARACQISSEVITLLKSGFPDGAFARWRSLYEVYVVGAFIAQEGEIAATRYLDHSAVEKWRAFEEQFPGNSEPAEINVRARLQADFESMIAKYGRSFETAYGWAAYKTGKNRRGFGPVEEAVHDKTFKQWRHFYRSASYGIHANIHGIAESLATKGEDIILLGGSNTGIADVTGLVALTLVQFTSLIVTFSSDVGHLAAIKMQARIHAKIDALCGKHLKDDS